MQTTFASHVEQITSNTTYQQILKDSFGGVMYNVANRGKYDTQELVNIWESMTDQERNAVDGVMKGAMHFVTEKI